MPDKPLWLHRIPAALATLAESPLPWVERATVETLLGVRRRRAQQILAHLVTEERGRVVLVEKAALVDHLRRLAAGEAAFYERRRRHQTFRDINLRIEHFGNIPRKSMTGTPSTVSSFTDQAPRKDSLCAGHQASQDLQMCFLRWFQW